MAFVVLGFVVIWLGYLRRWRFVRNVYFRAAHLAAMGYVALEALTGITCPLTTWEARFRAMAGGQGDQYQGSFIQHWVHHVLFFDLPEWVFTVIYVLFFALILVTLWFVRPQRNRG